MARYEWPRDFLRSPDRLLHRQEFNLGLREPGQPFFDTTALDQLGELVRHRTIPSLTWLPLGPSMLLNGQAAGMPMVAGRVRDLHVNAAGTRAYAGTANGGVWYWEQGDGAWCPVGSWGLQPGMLSAGDRAKLSLTVGALIVRFGETGGADDPTKDVVYVGTGELRPGMTAAPGGKHAGIGVLRLDGQIGTIVDTPGGNPWQREAPNLTGLGIYRLAFDPAHPPETNPATVATLVAATSDGLFFRNGPFQADGDWTEVAKSALDFDNDETVVFTDAFWHPTTGLWVTAVAEGGDDGLFRAPNGPAGAFTRVDLPEKYHASYSFGWYERFALSFPLGVNNRFYVLGKRSGDDVGHSALWRVDVAGATAAAKLVDDVPRAVFASSSNLDRGFFGGFIVKKDQARYDMAVTSVPDTDPGKDTVYVGGATHKPRGGGDWNASIFKLTVEAFAGGYRADFDVANELQPGEDDTFIGRGIHADVHQLAHRPNGLWVACDGGVFRREDGGRVQALNAGLAVLEAGYIDGHPKLDGSILAGLQDNAVIQRTGDTVWYRRTDGDGGGVAYHPSQPRRYLDQYTYADWTFRQSTSEDGNSETDAHTVGPSFADDEDTYERAYFYSKPAAAPGPTADTAQVCLGTDRLWYSCNWGQAGAHTKWVTIPSNDDPADATFFGGSQDSYERIRVVRFAAPGAAVTYSDGTTKAMNGAKVLALSGVSLRLFTFTARPADNDGDWTSKGDAVISGDHPKEKYAEDDVASPFLAYLPRPSGLAWTDVAPHSAAQGSCYVTTTGKTEEPEGGGTPRIVEKYDTLWWYDGEGRWYPTGLLTTPVDVGGGTAGARASAHSVIVDPEGIPDFTSPGSMTNANRHDFVYVGTKLGVWRGRLTFTENPAHAGDASQPRWRPSWEWEPYFDGLPQAVVEDLSFHIETRPVDGGGTKTIKLLRAAITSRGVWELDLSPSADSVGRTYLRSYNLDTGRRPVDALETDPYSGRAIGDPHSASPDIIALSRTIHDIFDDNWGAALPNEAEILALPRTSRLRRTSAAPEPANVAYVLAHHRQIEPIATTDVTVHLLAWKNRPYEADGTTPTPMENLALTDPVRTAIMGTLQGTPPDGTGEILHLGTQHPTLKIDARMPRAVRFEFDLDYPFDGALAEDTVLLIAVVDSPSNHLQASDLAHPNLVEVTRRSSLIAAARFKRI